MKKEGRERERRERGRERDLERSTLRSRREKEGGEGGREPSEHLLLFTLPFTFCSQSLMLNQHPKLISHPI